MSTEVRLRYPIQIQKGQRMSEPQNGRGALFAGGLAAILASTCCLGPLVLVALGFSGAWIGNLTVLEPYRPLFIGAALVALFFAWKRIYRPVQACKPGEVGRHVTRRADGRCSWTRLSGHAGRCPLSFDAGRIARQDARSAGQKRQDG